MKKLKLNKIITFVLEAENGFSRIYKGPSKDLPRVINIPFMYRIRVTSPVIGDYIDLEITPNGEFQLTKLTKSRAVYKLSNMYQAKAIIEK